MVLGQASVGKSALTIRCVTGQFSEEYDPTIEDSYYCTINVNDRKWDLDIYDTAGQEEYASMTNLYYDWINGGDHYMLCYDVTSEQSLEWTKVMRERILRSKEDNDERYTIALIATKYDIYDGSLTQSQMRLTRSNLKDLVYGYLRDGERKLWNQNTSRDFKKIIPEGLQAICLRYHGDTPSNIQVTAEMGKALAASWSRDNWEVPFIETSAKTDHNVAWAFARVLEMSL